MATAAWSKVRVLSGVTLELLLILRSFPVVNRRRELRSSREEVDIATLRTSDTGDLGRRAEGCRCELIAPRSGSVQRQRLGFSLNRIERERYDRGSRRGSACRARFSLRLSSPKSTRQASAQKCTPAPEEAAPPPSNGDRCPSLHPAEMASRHDPLSNALLDSANEQHRDPESLTAHSRRSFSDIVVPPQLVYRDQAQREDDASSASSDSGAEGYRDLDEDEEDEKALLVEAGEGLGGNSHWAEVRMAQLRVSTRSARPREGS